MLISFVVLFSFIMNFQGLWLTLIYRPTTKGKTGGNEKAIGIDQQGAWSTFLLISPHNHYPIKTMRKSRGIWLYFIAALKNLTERIPWNSTRNLWPIRKVIKPMILNFRYLPNFCMENGVRRLNMNGNSF